MNAYAYVVALLHPLFLLDMKNVEVLLGPLHSLADDINTLNLPQDAFRHNSYQRSGHKGFYLSNNLWDFVYNGKGDRDEEGCILIIDFKTTKLNPQNRPEPLAFLLHPHEFSDADKRKVDQYIQTMHKDLNMRLVNKLIP